jgi:hypothetical protein
MNTTTEMTTSKFETLNAAAYVQIDPKTGCHLGPATPAQIAAFVAQPCRFNNPAFRRPIMVGAVLVDEHTGPGIWFGGAGF